MFLVLALVLLGWAGYPAVPDYPARYPDIIWQEKAGYWQGMPNNPAKYLASGKKNQIWSNPS